MLALWLDCRTYEKKPTLKRVSDFVLVNPVVHQEFNDFSKAEITPELQLLLALDLIKVWETDKALSLPRVSRYQKVYVNISSSQLDDLCLWVYDMRKLYNSRGSLFEVVNKRASMPQTLTSLTSAAESSQRVSQLNLPVAITRRFIIKFSSAVGTWSGSQLN